MPETEKHLKNENGKYVVVRYDFFLSSGRVVEFTYREGCSGSPREWAEAHRRQGYPDNPDSKAKVDWYESAVPVRKG